MENATCTFSSLENSILYFCKCENTGLFTKALWDLYAKERNRYNKSTPQIGIIDSQTIKSTEVKQPKGFDRNKKIKGIKCFILVDSFGIVLHARVEPTNVSEKHGAKNLLSGLKPIYPTLIISMSMVVIEEMN